MNKPFFLRPMWKEDLPLVSNLDKLCFAEPWPERAFAYELTTDYSICLVAVDENERIIGAVVVWVIVDEAHIATIAVHPDSQHAGVGSCLLAQSLLVAYARGARSSLLEVRQSNLTALKLYQRFGYQAVGFRKNYYQDNQEDALLLTLASIDKSALEEIISAKCL